MADYSTGNIFIELETKSDSTINALNSTIKTLNKLNKSLTKISEVDFTKVNKSFDSISKLDFSKITETFKPLETINATNLNSFTRALKTISTLNFDNVDFTKLESQLKQLSVVVDPFLQKIKEAEPSLVAFSNSLTVSRYIKDLEKANKKLGQTNGKLKQTKSNIQSIDNSTFSLKSSLKDIFDFGKIYVIFNYAKQYFAKITSSISNAINFEETLNKFQVSFRGYYDEALDFTNELTRAFNLSTESIMNYSSTFNNMLNALGGLARETSFELSKSLTRMAIDYASLFNVSVETAMEQFTSALSGQTKSIRTTSGYDITESTLESVYESIGGTKSIRQLNQVEKRLLIILAIQQQMEQTGATGDFQNTINTTSNMLKQLQETLKEVSTWAGLLVKKYLEPIVRYALSGAIALREMLKSFAEFSGYKFPNFMSDDNTTENIENATEAVGNYEDEIESLSNVMLGFDKLNILGSGSATEGMSEDIEKISEAIKKYENNMSGVTNEANQIAEKIMVWLGFTKNAEDGIWDFNSALNDTDSKFNKIKNSIKNIASILGGVVIGNSVGKLATSGKGFLSVLSKIGFKGGLIVSLISLAVAGFVELYNTNDEFKKSVNETFSSIWNSLKKIYQVLAPIIKQVIKPIIESLGNSVKIVLDLVDAVFKIVTLDFDNLDSSFQKIFSSMDKLFNNIGEIVDWVSGLFNKIFDWVFEIIKNLPQIVNNVIDLISNILKNVIKLILDNIVGLIANLISSIVSFISNVIQELPDLLTNLISGIITHVIKLIIESVQSTISNIPALVSSIWKIIKSILKLIVDNLPTLLLGGVDILIKVIMGVISSLAKEAKKAVKSLAKEFGSVTSYELMNAWKKFTNAVKNFFSSIGNWITNKILKPIANAFIEWLNSIGNFVKGFGDIFGADWGWEIPKLAKGGVIDKPTTVMVGEYSGATTNPEIVTPENKMREVFMESMLPLAQAILNGDREVVKAINDKDISFKINGREFYETTYNDLKGVSRRVGDKVFAK